MKPVTIEVECSGCCAKLQRRVEPIHPSQFTNPKEARMRSFFWCTCCGSMLGVYYIFEEVEDSPEETKVSVGQYLDVSKYVSLQPATKAITVRPRAKRPRNN